MVPLQNLGGNFSSQDWCPLVLKLMLTLEKITTIVTDPVQVMKKTKN